jgi:zinc/manganese transport system substrate-binding protein
MLAWTGRTAGLLGVALVASLLAGCGDGSADVGSSRPLKVVAAENFYGDLALDIGGSHVSVISVLSNPDTDPHLFEPGTRAGLAVAAADVVIVNGAGYDEWMTKLLDAAPSSHRRVLTVAALLHVSGADPNPHLWYDAPALPAVVAGIGAAMSRADPTHDLDYRAGIARTTSSLGPLLTAVTALRFRFAGSPVAYTERVPGLMLAAAGLRVLTPSSFARSVEDGTDPTPADESAMTRLLSTRRVKVLLYNEQATSALTVRLRRVAQSAGVAVVPVTETEPAGQSFTAWQLSQVQALTRALAR